MRSPETCSIASAFAFNSRVISLAGPGRLPYPDIHMGSGGLIETDATPAFHSVAAMDVSASNSQPPSKTNTANEADDFPLFGSVEFIGGAVPWRYVSFNSLRAFS